MRTVRGTVASRWQREAEGVRYVFVIPAGSTGSVRVRAPDGAAITEGGKPLVQVPNVQLEGHGRGVAALRLGSGRYELFVPGG